MEIIEKKPYPTAGDLWAIIGIFIVANLAGGGAAMLIKQIFPQMGGMDMFLGYLLGMGVTLIYATYQRLERKAVGDKLFYFNPKGINIPIILYGTVLVFAVGIVIEPLIDIFPKSMLEYLNSAIGRGPWSILTAVVAAPVLEELLFRGVILQGIRERSGALKAVLISSAIFGAIHIIPPQAINAFFVALVIGFIYVRSGSLWTVIIIHAINNAISYVISGGDNPFITTREIVGNDTLYYIIYGFTLAVTCYLVFRIYRELQKVDRQVD